MKDMENLFDDDIDDDIYYKPLLINIYLKKKIQNLWK